MITTADKLRELYLIDSLINQVSNNEYDPLSSLIAYSPG